MTDIGSGITDNKTVAGISYNNIFNLLCQPLSRNNRCKHSVYSVIIIGIYGNGSGHYKVTGFIHVWFGNPYSACKRFMKPFTLTDIKCPAIFKIADAFSRIVRKFYDITVKSSFLG